MIDPKIVEFVSACTETGDPAGTLGDTPRLVCQRLAESLAADAPTHVAWYGGSAATWLLVAVVLFLAAGLAVATALRQAKR